MSERDDILRTLSSEEQRLYRAIGGRLPRFGMASEPDWHKVKKWDVKERNDIDRMKREKRLNRDRVRRFRQKAA